MVAYMWNTDRKAMIVRILDALAVVKSMTELPYRYLWGSEDAVTYQCARHKNAAAWIVPFKLKCAKHSFTEGSIHHLDCDEDVFTCIQAINVSNVFENCKDFLTSLYDAEVFIQIFVCYT